MVLNQNAITWLVLLFITKIFACDENFSYDTRTLPQPQQFYDKVRGGYYWRYTEEFIANSSITCSHIESLHQIYYSNQNESYHRFLTVTNSDIPTLPSMAFSKMSSITKLYLSQLHIRIIQPRAFANLTNLTELHLDNNELTELPSKVFNSLNKLQILNLTSNKICRIENTALMGLTNLSALYLGNNEISKIEDDLFETQEQLKHLDLSNNPLEKFSINGVTNLKELLLTRTSLTHLDVDFSHLEMKLLNLSSSRLSTVDFSQFPNVDRVNLANNSIVSILNCQTLSSLHVNLDNNKIEAISGNFSSVSELYMSHNSLTILENTLFDNLNVLLTADFSFNQVSQIDKDVFQGLKSLLQLFLHNNNITKIDPGLFRDLTSLTILNLSNNRIEEFQYGTFDSLEELEILDISHNQLLDLHQYTFNSLSRLSNFHFDYNKISSFDVRDLNDHLPELRLVSLDNNPWNCKDLVNIGKQFEYANVVVAEGSDFDVDNFHGIRCLNLKTVEKSKFSDDIFAKTIAESVKNSKMSSFFNQDFRNSEFFQYFNRDFIRSDFFRYLDNYKFATVQQQNTSNTKMERITSLQVTPNDSNNKILIIGIVVHVMTSSLLLLIVYFMFAFLKKSLPHRKPELSSQIELC